ncbi:MAG: hypothetical protein OSB26_17765 [Woeseiaceae bacterium]|nr:hypothetical protein [Woeseiaceae bacterium]
MSILINRYEGTPISVLDVGLEDGAMRESIGLITPLLPTLVILAGPR